MTRLAAMLALLLGSGCAHRTDPHHRTDPGAQARQAVIEANLHELQACWSDLAAAYPGVSGSLLFGVDLRTNGSVEWVEVLADDIGAPKLVACTVRHIKRWRFPEHRKRRSISFGVGFAAP